MRAPTDLAAATGALDPDPPAQLGPVRRVEAAEITTDRHGRDSGSAVRWQIAQTNARGPTSTTTRPLSAVADRLKPGVCLVWAGGTAVCGHGWHFSKWLISLSLSGRDEPKPAL
jgi:hypothetical protein